MSLFRWILTGILIGSANAQAELTLAAAERLALTADPAILSRESRARALFEQAVADGQLPDPQLLLGIWNLPLDDFDPDKLPTTQWRTGLSQAFPRGDSLKYRRAHTEWLGRAESAGARAERAQIRRDVRLAYLELYYRERAAAILARSRELFEQLVEITRAHYASGRVSQQDVLQAQLELSRLDDRATRIDKEGDVQRATLARWIGAAADQALTDGFPALPEVPAQATLQAALTGHPAIEADSAKVRAGQQRVREAREQYKPGFSVGVEYRKRFGEDPDGSDRPDLMAAMVRVDLPVFADKRQDRRLAASQLRVEAAAQSRDLQRRELLRSLNADYARLQRLDEQVRLYREQLLPESADNAAAAVKAYQSGNIEFTSLMRARLTELDVRLQAMRLRVDRAKARARLLYLAPETGAPRAGSQGEPS